MNKIIIDKDRDIIVDSDSLIIINSCNNLNIKIKNAYVFMYIDKKNITINFDIAGDSKINIFAIDSSLNCNLDINVKNVNLTYNYSAINISNNNYYVNINHNKEHTKTNVISHAINLTDSKLDFMINTNIINKAIEVSSLQDSKILLRGKNNSIIKPNLLVDNSKIDANHSAYIGSFNQDDLFYLESRGLSLKKAELVLAKAFLINKMEIPFLYQELLINKLKEYWR